MKITIDKAVKNLKAAKEDSRMVPNDEWVPTLNMAVGALIRVSDMRASPCTTANEILPSETIEK